MTVNAQAAAAASRIVVVGAGAVGAATAYTLMLRQRAAEIVLIDIETEKARGEALDMQHGRVFAGGTNVRHGSYADCRMADIVVVTAGRSQRAGQGRDVLLADNSALTQSIVSDVVAHTETPGILLMASNPVDAITHIAWQVSGWPATRVLGSGTSLDSARFRDLIGRAENVAPHSVEAEVYGEHGDTQRAIIDGVRIAGVSPATSVGTLESLADDSMRGGYEVINAKGNTCYAVALAIDAICGAILNDDRSVMNVSTLVDNWPETAEVYMSLPCVIGRRGIERRIEPALSESDRAALVTSARMLRQRVEPFLV